MGQNAAEVAGKTILTHNKTGEKMGAVFNGKK